MTQVANTASTIIPCLRYRAMAAGARIVMEISNQDYGGRGHACRDPEAHLWWFGSCDPSEA